ncbi:Uncharacterized protein YktA, UPF0223 family [Gracilibacillus ureilyticus]|uniref:UPF0223 protein SAMN04487944_11437 n=1 Tax=Gracilibacillus ureilyticus TaxID=531814 RepID=A0A1H9TJY8_9BACI|nr:UPF0223 family protein [Gracilibacillus ureilyticus]SER97418.1 Uncharacterized protein YktA, UPF0223 family [Gracilibacillus ureilyticus]
MNYSYPLNDSWSTEEIVDVINYYSFIEKAYEKGIIQQDLLLAYNRFKQIVPSKSEEKQLDREFEKQSGYIPFRVIKYAKEKRGNDLIKMK